MIWIFLRSLEVTCLQQIKQVICFSVWVTKITSRITVSWTRSLPFGWPNWFWQLLCDSLSFFNPKGFYYSYTWSCSLCERRTSCCKVIISRKLCRFSLLFSTSFTSRSVLLIFPLSITFLHLDAWFLILFHLIYIRFSRYIHLLMCLSLETLMFIIRTG